MNDSRAKKAWGIVFVIFLAGIAMAWSQNKVIPIIADIMNIFHVNKTSAGWLSSIFCVTGIIIAIPAGWFLKRIGLKKSGLLAIAIAFFGAIVGLIAPSFELLMFSRVIEGVGVGMISVVAPSAIAMWFPPEKRGLPMGIWGSWQMVAQGGNFFFAIVLTASFGWKGMWYFGLILLAAAAVLYLFVVDVPKASENYAPIESADIDMLKGLRVLNPWLLSLGGMLFSFVYFGWCTWVAQYWIQELHVQESLANTYLGYMCILEIPVVLVMGYTLDHLKNRKTMAAVSSLAYIVILFFSYRLGGAQWILPFIIIYPIVEGGIPTFLWTVVAETYENPNNSGLALAILTIGMNLGTVLGPPFMGFIIENFGWKQATLPLIFGMLLSLLCMMKVNLYQSRRNQ